MNLKELVSPKRREKGLWWQRALSLVEGCTPVSEACEHCWAASQAHMRAAQSNKKIHDRYSGLTKNDGKWNGKLRLLEKNLGLPKKVKKPTLWAVWNDLFHPGVPIGYIQHALGMMLENPHHFFLVLTKRIERLAKMTGDLPDNLGIGTTVELPKYLPRVKTLLQIPAALHFVSLEPLLGAVELHLDCFEVDIEGQSHFWHSPDCPGFCDYSCGGLFVSGGIDWVILGCESGRHRRQMHPGWAEVTIRDCRLANVPLFFKQIERDGKVTHAPTMMDGKPLVQFPEVEWKPCA